MKRTYNPLLLGVVLGVAVSIAQGFSQATTTAKSGMTPSDKIALHFTFEFRNHLN